MLILLHVERLVVVPAELSADLQAVQTVLDRAFVRARAHGCISERNEPVVVRREYFPRILGRFVENNDHEGAHEEGSVRLLGVVERSVVVNFVLLVLLVCH